MIKYRDYVGLAGDIHVLLIGETDTGERYSSLYSRGFFANFNRNRAKKRIAKRLMKG